MNHPSPPHHNQLYSSGRGELWYYAINDHCDMGTIYLCLSWCFKVNMQNPFVNEVYLQLHILPWLLACNTFNLVVLEVNGPMFSVLHTWTARLDILLRRRATNLDHDTCLEFLEAGWRSILLLANIDLIHRTPVRWRDQIAKDSGLTIQDAENQALGRPLWRRRTRRSAKRHSVLCS